MNFFTRVDRFSSKQEKINLVSCKKIIFVNRHFMTRTMRRNVGKEGEGMPDDFDWQLVMESGDRGNAQVSGLSR